MIFPNKVILVFGVEQCQGVWLQELILCLCVWGVFRTYKYSTFSSHFQASFPQELFPRRMATATVLEEFLFSRLLSSESWAVYRRGDGDQYSGGDLTCLAHASCLLLRCRAC